MFEREKKVIRLKLFSVGHSKWHRIDANLVLLHFVLCSKDKETMGGNQSNIYQVDAYIYQTSYISSMSNNYAKIPSFKFESEYL